MAVLDIKESNRPSKEINQLSTVSEGIPALGWVTLVSFSLCSLDSTRRTYHLPTTTKDSKPGPFVGDMKDSAQFYANRVVKDNKESSVSPTFLCSVDES